MCGWRTCQKESSVTALDGWGVESIVQKLFAQRGGRRWEEATYTVSVNSLLQQERRYDRWVLQRSVRSPWETWCPRV